LIKRKKLAEKLLLLRCRIEDWTSFNGWDNMDNHTVRKNKDGSIVWKQTDWEFVDNMYGSVVNGPAGFGNDYFFDKDTVKKWNRMWHRYKIDITVVRPDNASLEPEWEQLQQMDWDDLDMDVTLGPDPAMMVKG